MVSVDAFILIQAQVFLEQLAPPLSSSEGPWPSSSRVLLAHIIPVVIVRGFFCQALEFTMVFRTESDVLAQRPLCWALPTLKQCQHLIEQMRSYSKPLT